MAKKDKFNLNSLPTVEQLTEKNLRRGQRLIDAGVSPGQVSNLLEHRSMLVRSFMSQQFDLLEKCDKELLESAGKHLFKMNLGALVPAIGLNIALRSLTRGKIFDLHFFFRFTIRTSIFALPIGYSSNYTYHAYNRLILYMEDKYCDRIERFRKTGDPSMINPYFDQEN